MAAQPVRLRPALTYDDYRWLPPDGRRWELIDGDFEVTPAPTPFHQTVSRRLQYELMTFLEKPGIALVFDAPIDVILERTTVVQPDLVLVAQSRRAVISARGIEGSPDVVVEVLSPSTRGNDLELKRNLYCRFAIPEYWIVDPDASSIDVLGFRDGEYQLRQRLDRTSTLRSSVFPVVEIDLEPIFRPL